MRKIVFALSVVLFTVMTACEDNNDSTINRKPSAVPFFPNSTIGKNAYEAGVPTVTTTQTYSYSPGTIDRIHYRTKVIRFKANLCALKTQHQ